MQHVLWAMAAFVATAGLPSTGAAGPEGAVVIRTYEVALPALVRSLPDPVGVTTDGSLDVGGVLLQPSDLEGIPNPNEVQVTIMDDVLGPQAWGRWWISVDAPCLLEPLEPVSRCGQAVFSEYFEGTSSQAVLPDGWTQITVQPLGLRTRVLPATQVPLPTGGAVGVTDVNVFVPRATRGIVIAEL